MNLEPTARSQPSMPSEDGVTSMEGRSMKAWSEQRGYSDSVVPRAHVAAEKECGLHRHASATLKATLCSCGEPAEPGEPGKHESGHSANHHRLSTRVKARHNLQLPSFKSLGITGPTPRALLTPPDEATLLEYPPPSITPGHILRSSSFPQDPRLKSSEVIELSPVSNTRISDFPSTVPTTHSMADLPKEETPKAEDSIASDGSEGGSISQDRAEWLVEAVDMIGGFFYF